MQKGVGHGLYPQSVRSNAGTDMHISESKGHSPQETYTIRAQGCRVNIRGSILCQNVNPKCLRKYTSINI